MGENEMHRGMSGGEVAQLGGVGRLLARSVPTTVLPDVVEDRQPVSSGGGADRIEQRIGGAAARGEFDADGAGRAAPLDFGERVVRAVRVDADLGADASGLLALQAERPLVAVG